MMNRSVVARVSWTLVLAVLQSSPDSAAGQEVRPEAFVPPISGTWEPVQSLGQPPRWKPFIGFGFGVDRMGEESQAGPTGSLGVYRDVLNPVMGLLGVTTQAYIGQRGELLDAGARFLVGAPALFVHAGLDWNARLQQTDFAFAVSFPTTRGGWFRRGGELRLEWIPARDHSVIVGAVVPVNQPLAGRTRPRQVSVTLPDPPRVQRLAPPDSGPVQEAIAEFDQSMEWLIQLHNIFWLMERKRLRYEVMVERSRASLASFRAELAARASLLPDRTTYEREVEHYHRTLDVAFGLVVGALPHDAQAVGRATADRARTITLEEVILPYNRTIGRYKQPDVLGGLVARARARFIAWLELENGLDADQGREALRVFDAWIDGFDILHRRIADLSGDSRVHWLPLALVLRTDQHETQEQIDALLELALGRGFSSGNATLLVNAPQFQAELQRTIHETENYHVLWIHDYKGYDEVGSPDRTAFSQTVYGYLRALLDQVRAYDETGRLPVYILMLDQHYYERSGSRLWLDLLESPLTHRIRLPHRFDWMQQTVEALQDSLRTAVTQSHRLNAEAEAFGRDWIPRVIKVHVNITNPSDFSFRSRHLLGVPFGADNLMRDHRKIVIRDVTEADPSIGEVILAGVGVGDHFASPTWEDRAILLEGPAALPAKAMAREVLEANYLRGDAVPAPLRPVPFALDYAQRVEQLERSGATARVMQAHNRTGWGDKDATYVQMLLYDLAPPGTVIYVPDSVWTSYEWMAQLVSAALRGCRVYVIAPARHHAPSDGFPQMAVMQELVTRLVIVNEQLGDLIQEAGGELRIGLYTRSAPMDDLPARVTEVDSTFARYPFLQRLFPFPDTVWQLIRSFAEPPVIASSDRPELVGDARERRPMMHRKTQLVATASLIERLAREPRLLDVLNNAFVGESEGAVRPPESGPLPAQERMHVSRRLFDVHDALPRSVRDSAVLYFMVGSLNKDVRSMALDGEALAVVAGRWALQAVLDFFFLSGSVTWVHRVDEVVPLLPPYPTHQLWIGRRLWRVL